MTDEFQRTLIFLFIVHVLDFNTSKLKQFIINQLCFWSKKPQFWFNAFFGFQADISFKSRSVAYQTKRCKSKLNLLLGIILKRVDIKTITNTRCYSFSSCFIRVSNLSVFTKSESVLLFTLAILQY